LISTFDVPRVTLSFYGARTFHKVLVISMQGHGKTKSLRKRLTNGKNYQSGDRQGYG